MDRQALSEPPRVLIADDSSDIRRLWQVWLTYSGFLVHEAGDGVEALALARRHRLDLILMDLHMPVMDGVEAIRQLRADPVTADVPILMVTAEGTDESVNRARQAGADAYLDKPVTPDELLQHIRAVWDRPRGARREMIRLRTQGFPG
jgi:CheY-like chemotaxis protein